MKSVKDILSKSSYQQQINSAEWRAFASQIRQHRKACECCRQGNVVTHVHHLFYDWSRKLHEYEPDEVMVLCEICHKALHEELSKFRTYVFRYLSPQCFKTLNGALAVGLTQYDPLVFCHALAEFVSNPNLVENHAKAWGTTSKPNIPFDSKWNKKDLEAEMKRRMDKYK